MFRLASIISAAILLFGCASNDHASHPDGQSDASTPQFKVTVALDMHGYQLRELSLLEEIVSEAARSRLNGAVVDTEDGAVSVTVWNAKKDNTTIDTVTKVARNRRMSLDVRPAKAFWVRYSANSAVTLPQQRLEEPRLSEGYIKSLRPDLPGVTVSQDGEAAIVQTTSPSFATTLVKILSQTFVIRPVTPTSWRVTWDAQFLSQAIPPEKTSQYVGETAEAVRSFLGDPLELQVYEGGDPNNYGGGGVHFLVLEPALHEAFIESVRKAFGRDPRFALREFEANSARFVSFKTPQKAATGLDDELMDAVENALAPQIKRHIEGDGVIVEAEDPAHGRDVRSIVRQALAGRRDLILKPHRNGLRVELARGAHLGPTHPAMSGTSFLQAVTAQINTAGIHPANFLPVGSTRVQVILDTQADADTLRAALSRPTALTIRLVDEKPKGISNSPPPNGDTVFRLPTGEEIWVTPASIVTGDMIADATVTESRFTQLPIIQLRMTDEGRSRFAEATRLHFGRRLAIVVDGRAVTAPVIMSPILDGTIQIEGNFSAESAGALMDSILPRRNNLLLTME